MARSSAKLGAILTGREALLPIDFQFKFHKRWFIYYCSAMGLMGSSLTGRLWHPVWAILCGLVLAGLVFLLAVGMARRNSDKIINNRTLLLIFAFALGGIPYFIHILVRGDSVRRYSPFILSGPILVMSLFAIWLICDFLAARKNHISPSVLSGIDSG